MSLDWQNILFALEDILGGSSSISNTVMRALAFIAQNPEVQTKIQAEIDEHLSPDVSPVLIDRNRMVYTDATILEVLRHTSSPIVPHVANQDTSIGGNYYTFFTTKFFSRKLYW